MYEISYLNVEKGQEDWEAIVKKVLDKCFEIAGTLTSNNSASAFCVIQKVSSLKITFTQIFVSSI